MNDTLWLIAQPWLDQALTIGAAASFAMGLWFDLEEKP